MSKKFLYVVSAAVCTVVFVACGGDSSSGAKDDGIPEYKKLPATCETGEEAKVGDTLYVCTDGEWLADIENVESSDGNPKSEAGSSGKESSSSVKESNADEKDLGSSSSGKNTDSGSSGTSGDSADSGSANSGADSANSSADSADSGSGSSSSGAAPISTTSVTTEFLNSGVSYGEYVDKRDGQVYKTVTIGDQVWLAQNLNLKYLDGEGSYCRNNDEESCETTGRLYTWAAAMDTATKYSDKAANCGEGKTCDLIVPIRGICPEDGWRLPSKNDWERLVAYVGEESTAGKILKSKTGWEGGNGLTDDYGFSAVRSGYRDDDGKYDNSGTIFWSSTEESNIYVYALRFRDSEDRANIIEARRPYARPVRCVKDLVVEPTSGSFTDGGQTYKTVKIGNITWMAQNLNKNVDGSLCYGNLPANCETYGRLYTWAMAVGNAECDYGTKCNLTGNIQGICPDGWRLPTSAEFSTLFEDVGGEHIAGHRLKSTSGWHDYESNGKSYGNGLDVLGFSVFPAGAYTRNGQFDSDGYYTYFWTATESNAYNAKYAFLSYYSYSASTLSEYKDNYFSVRCVKVKP